MRKGEKMQERDHKIEKGIPISPTYNYWTELAKKMEVTDSVLFATREKSRGLAIGIKQTGHSYTGRTVENGYRIWKGGLLPKDEQEAEGHNLSFFKRNK